MIYYIEVEPEDDWDIYSPQCMGEIYLKEVTFEEILDIEDDSILD